MPTNHVWIGTTSTAFGTTTNWLAGSVPVTGDTVTIDGRAQNDLAGSDQSAITLAALRVVSSCTKRVGTNSAGTVTPLKIGATLCDINLPSEGGNTGSGPPTCALDFAAILMTTTVWDGRDSGESGFSCILLRGTNASNKVVVKGKASVGIATITPGEATTVVELDINETSNVTVGYGVTLTTVNQTGGTGLINSAFTTLNQTGGKLTTRGTGAITTANVGGEFISDSTGTITTATASGAGKFDLSQSPLARTVTTAKVDGPNAKILADNGAMRTGSLSITFTNAIVCQNGADSTQVDLGPVSLTPS